MSIFKRKSFYIILVIILLGVGGVVYAKYRSANKPVQYETVKVKRGDVNRTVEVTGKVQSTNDLSLRFETGGTVALISVSEGQSVKSGEMLANLNLSELNSAITKASSDLNKQLAGATTEELNSLKATVDAAKAAVDAAKASASSSVATAESDLQTALNNLKLAQGGDSSQIVTDAYEDAVAILQKTSYVIDDGLVQADNILGVDNTLANDSFEAYLSTKDPTKLNTAVNYFSTAKKSKKDASQLILPITTASSHADIDSAMAVAETALSNVNQLLSYTSDVLNNTSPVGNLTQTVLDGKKTTIASTRSTVTTQYTSLISQKQAIYNAKNSYTAYKITYDTAVKNLDAIKQQQAANIKSKEASYDQAYANYKDKLNPPREVDVASYRALLAQAQINRNKAVLNAPMDGQVTKIYKKKGEYISASETMIDMTAKHYEIEVDVPETDISKINLNNQVSYTLDAFGDSYKLSGKVFSIDPKSTEIQDVVYYRVKISIVDDDIKSNSSGKEIKPGMTANASINTDGTGAFKNVLYVPLRAVLTDSNNSKYVRVLEGGQVKNITVVLGNKVDNGMVVITSGLKEGQEVVLSVKGK